MCTFAFKKRCKHHFCKSFRKKGFSLYGPGGKNHALIKSIATWISFNQFIRFFCNFMFNLFVINYCLAKIILDMIFKPIFIGRLKYKWDWVALVCALWLVLCSKLCLEKKQVRRMVLKKLIYSIFLYILIMTEYKILLSNRQLWSGP